MAAKRAAVAMLLVMNRSEIPGPVELLTITKKGGIANVQYRLFEIYYDLERVWSVRMIWQLI